MDLPRTCRAKNLSTPDLALSRFLSNACAVLLRFVCCRNMMGMCVVTLMLNSQGCKPHGTLEWGLGPFTLSRPHSGSMLAWWIQLGTLANSSEFRPGIGSFGIALDSWPSRCWKHLTVVIMWPLLQPLFRTNDQGLANPNVSDTQYGCSVQGP